MIAPHTRLFPQTATLPRSENGRVRLLPNRIAPQSTAQQELRPPENDPRIAFKPWWLEPLADLCFGIAATALFLALASLVTADEPKVQFDTGYLVACREVTTPAFAAANPGQKLVEARFAVSSFILSGDEAQITQHVYRFEGVQGTVQVHDYLPRTTLDTRYAGPIAMQTENDKAATLNINLLGKYEALTGSTITADWNETHNAQSKYSLLPPLEAVAASGTLNRSRSVFFKLRGNDRTWLEGTKEFGLILATPQAWQADYLRVRCEAEGLRHVNGRDEKFACGQRDFLIGLFSEGDEAARQAAYQLVAAESQLRQQAAANRAQKQRHSPSNPFAALAQSFGGKESKPSTDWLPRVTWGLAQDDALLQQVPPEVRPAAEQYRAARQHVARLGGGRVL